MLFDIIMLLEYIMKNETPLDSFSSVQKEGELQRFPKESAMALELLGVDLQLLCTHACMSFP
jgi:hypothetical protein